jgi:SAM-dependent methyltransferase
MAIDEARRIFFEVHRDLPREGPGNRASTARALRLAGSIPRAARVADIGCGPGAQTLDLAELLSDAHIVAFDAHQPYLDELCRRAAAAGVSKRVDARRADMRALPLEPGSVDLLWCEGAAYIIGIPDALRLWKPLLKPGGRIALTEPVWLAPDPPAAARANWVEYPAMTDVASNRAIIARAELTLLGDFTLPEAAWDDYYRPLEARAKSLTARYADDPIAQGVLRDVAAEIDAYRRYSTYFGYQFFVMSA